MNSDYNKNMNKRLIWLIELALWALILVAVSFSVVFIQSIENQKRNSYYMFFHDVDGLMQGSPVRFMGMQIGYVQDIKVFENNVFVSFLVTQKSVSIPEHSTATVEFYGLGGSKSLEISPPISNEFATDYIVVKDPYRIQEFYDVQNNIARTIVNISSSFSMTVKENEIYKTQSYLKMSGKIKSADTALEKIVDFLDDLNNNKLKKYVPKTEQEDEPKSDEVE